MFTIFVYVLDTMADWELGYVISELNSVDFSKRASNVYRSKRLVILGSQSIQWAG